MKKEEMSLQTKQRLAAALKEEMARKPFDRITVSSLLQHSNITRPTFYYHFEDIYALMCWMFDTEMVQLLEKSDSCVTWDEGVYLVLEYVKRNEKVCLCAFHSVGWEMLERMFYKDTRAIMQKFIDNLLEDIPAKPEHIAFIGDFYTKAFVSCLANWLNTGMKQTPDEMVALLDIAMHGNIENALRRSARQ